MPGDVDDVDVEGEVAVVEDTFDVAFVAIARAPDDICEDDGEPADDALKADCALKAARKFARNGRFVDIVVDDVESGECDIQNASLLPTWSNANEAETLAPGVVTTDERADRRFDTGVLS